MDKFAIACEEILLHIQICDCTVVGIQLGWLCAIINLIVYQYIRELGLENYFSRQDIFTKFR